MKDILPVFAHSSRVEIIVDWRNLLDVSSTFSSVMYVKIVVGIFCTVDKEVNDFYEYWRAWGETWEAKAGIVEGGGGGLDATGGCTCIMGYYKSSGSMEWEVKPWP